MPDHVHTDAAPPSGGLIRLQVRAGDLGSWLGPTWAALCGVLASNASDWRGAGSIQLVLLILLVDAGWGSLWTALASTEWARPAVRWRRWRKNRTIATPPYTLPGTPGYRLGRWMGRALTWWREAFWPTCGSAVRVVLIFLPVTGLLSALLGPELILLSTAAVALMQIGVFWTGGRGTTPPGWDALIAVALPWLAGHAAFAPITLKSAGLATLLALAWGSVWNVTSGRAQAVLVASQLTSAVLLVALHRPLAAGALLLLLMAQVALLPAVRSDLPVPGFVRYSRLWLVAGMGVAALAL